MFFLGGSGTTKRQHTKQPTKLEQSRAHKTTFLFETFFKVLSIYKSEKKNNLPLFSTKSFAKKNVYF